MIECLASDVARRSCPSGRRSVYCSARCRAAAAVARHRSDYMKPTLAAIPEKRLQAVTPLLAPLAMALRWFGRSARAPKD